MNQFTKTHFSAKSIDAVNALLKTDKPIGVDEMPEYRARIRSAILKTVKEEGTFTLPLPFYNGNVEVTFNLIGATLYWQVKGKELSTSDLLSIEEWLDYMGITAVGTLGIWLGVTSKEKKVTPGLRSIYTHPGNIWTDEYKVIYVEGSEVAYILESLNMTFEETMSAIAATYFKPSTTVQIIVNSNSSKNANHDKCLEAIQLERPRADGAKDNVYTLKGKPVFLDYTNLDVKIAGNHVVKVKVDSEWSVDWIVIGAIIDNNLAEGLRQVTDALKRDVTRIYQADTSRLSQFTGQLTQLDIRKLKEASRLFGRVVD
jgi:hypothetical protein